MKNIAIFASGNGSNAENIIKFFRGSETACVTLVLSNKANAYVLQRAKALEVPTRVFGRESLKDGLVLSSLQEAQIDFIILAGFLWLLPASLIRAYPDQIINIHPSLLPKYGGKGMYGNKVHQAVIENGETESGITIHLVNEEYDKGKILLQARVDVNPEDTPDSLAMKIHQLEYQHFPEVIQKQVVVH
ncbi:MAG: phosphoribosylglycinamide formyltransferase [Bacteroidota bacterium]